MHTSPADEKESTGGVLRGSTAIITGASRGLGAQIARTMCAQGASLLLVSRSANDLAALAATLATPIGGQRVDYLTSDLGALDGPARVIDKARELWPRLDALVNNAAIIGPIGKAWETSWFEWNTTIRVNLLAPVELCRLAVSWMAGSGGSIINISGGGATGPRPYFTAYGTAKAALVRFSETLAQETAGLRVRVNCIAPGAMNTEMTAAVLRAGPAAAGAKEFASARSQSEAGATTPEAAAELVAFLASEASAGITGRLISAVWDPWKTLPGRVAELEKSDIYTLRRIVPSDRGQNWE
jgi:NAD(P)-dependent dehydrogenase (short-subunit alcohol dehydrogenase family)